MPAPMLTPEQCGAVIDIMAAQPEFAAMLCPYYEVPTVEADISERLSALHGALANGLRAASIPGFVVSYTSTHLSALSRRIVAETGMPYLACGVDRALARLAGTFAWSERLRQPRATARARASHAQHRPRSEPARAPERRAP